MKLGRADVAACVVLQVDTYARPGDMLGLYVADVLPPKPSAGPLFANRWAIVFGSSDGGAPVKNKHIDDTVDVGICDRGWLKDVLSALVRGKAVTDRLFNFDMAGYEHVFAKAVRALQLEQLRATPHSLRHTGPSHDRYTKKMDLAGIQKRGR